MCAIFSALILFLLCPQLCSYSWKRPKDAKGASHHPGDRTGRLQAVRHSHQAVGQAQATSSESQIGQESQIAPGDRTGRFQAIRHSHQAVGQAEVTSSESQIGQKSKSKKGPLSVLARLKANFLSLFENESLLSHPMIRLSKKNNIQNHPNNYRKRK